MVKKLFYCFIAMGCLIGISYFYLSKHLTEISSEEYCAFCDVEVLNRQKFYEDDLVFALYTHKPILPGHCLIIPKRHVERFEMLTDEEITQVGRVIKKVNQAALNVFNTSDYLILQKNDIEVSQSVPHVHFHYIPRQKGDDSTLKFLAKMYITNLQNPYQLLKCKI
ncbi:MAG: HIT family protein [Parachlamydiaceae bacterium]|nr:HIT family protein [Parachlamydiaceae bacterium]